MQISLDGFVGAERGGANFQWDPEVRSFSIANLQNVDTVLLGRNTAAEFIPYWALVAADPNAADNVFAKPMMAIPRVVFSNSVKAGQWENTTVVAGDLVGGIAALKNKAGGDVLVYGGYSFVSALIRNGLIDEYYLLVNPVALGSGEAIFRTLREHLPLELRKCQAFGGGSVLLVLHPKDK